MILLLDTSTPVCKLSFVYGDHKSEFEWEANRQLAKGLLGWLNERFFDEEKSWQDLTGIGVFSGPGSFTGLRIGLTVLNTLADNLPVPIVGATGENWQAEVIERLRQGENDRVVIPHYGYEANITTPK